MPAFQILLATLVGAVLFWQLVRRYRADAQARAEGPARLFRHVAPLLEAPELMPVAVAGSVEIRGRYRGQPVRIRAITDLLAVRKLPSLWLMVTIPVPVPVAARFDLMMRPAGQTSFSNFDDLPDTIRLPSSYPVDAVARTDDRRLAPSPALFVPFLAPFFGPRGKELLVAPEGVRLVLQAAQGSRARYGVFRQADFGEDPLDPALVAEALALLSDLHAFLQTQERLDDDPRSAAGAA